MANDLPFNEFAIVGIGASAGGLEAFSEIVRFLPPETGLAFVVVQHLDPHHESILGELLANQTQIPVLQISGNTAVEPNHIYVIPPNARLIIRRRELSLEPRPTGDEQHRPIDAFFSSLAKDVGTNAIGIVLSGNASDGTLGLKSINEAGGVTFAQDSSAKYDSMPRSAIAAGVVDFVLPPRQIAEDLAAIGRRSVSGAQTGDETFEEGPAFHAIIKLLRTTTGVDFTQYTKPTVIRRMVRRMMLRNNSDQLEYLELLRAEPGEIQALFNDLLINVTEFFRDPRVFESLKEIAFPFMTQNRPASDTIRCWVPGCSSGEEVYSIAIVLSEYLSSENLDFAVQVFGTDVNEKAIEKARSGVFDESAVANVSPERLRRFFRKTDSGYRISRSIRDLCVFSRHNLGKDPALSRMSLISCRNLLIYFTPQLQKRVISTFGHSLQPSGCLVLGPSESLGSLVDRFTPLDAQSKIYCRKADMTRSAFDLAERMSGLTSASHPEADDTPDVQDGKWQLAADRKHMDDMLLSQFRASALVVGDDMTIVDSRGDVGPFLKTRKFETGADFLNAVQPDFLKPLRSGLRDLQTEPSSIRLDKISLREGEKLHFVQTIMMRLAAGGGESHTLVLFETIAAPGSTAASKGAHSIGPNAVVGAAATPRFARNHPPEKLQRTDPAAHVLYLEQELSSTRQYLQSIIEELRSTNEEVQSSNEELQATNEELQTAKEELQSANEELNTVNLEMQSRNSELSRLNDDLINLLSSMNMPVVMLGSDLRIRRFTPTAERVLNLIATDVGRPISDLKPRINVPNLQEILQGVLDTLVVSEREVQDQEGRWYLLRVRPYRTSDNRIDGAVLQLLDVSELKRSLEEVRHSRDYVQTIFDTIREPVVVLDSKLNIQKANRSFYQFLDLREESEIGASISEVSRGSLASPKIQELLQAVRSDGKSLQEVEVTVEHKPGDHRTMSLNARRLQSPENADLLLLAFQDETEKNREAEARYRRLFESAKDGIIVVDAVTAEVTDVNPFVEQLLGYAREELIGQRLWDVDALREATDIRSALSQIREQNLVRFQDLSLKTSDGGERQVEVVANAYSEKDRRVIQLNIRDLTERKKFERELQHTQKLESLGLLAGGIAHDFNNLLTGILGNASIAYSDTPADDPVRIHLREIIDAAERAAFLTRQMLAYAGKGRYVTHTLQLGDLIREISVLVRTSVPKNVEINLDLPGNIPPIDADPGQIQQLIMNLVINGAESVDADKSGSVEVRTTVRTLSDDDVRVNYSMERLSPGEYVSLEVRDNGSGMDDKTKARIFDPFFTTKFAGRGLGLAAALGIVNGHHGAVRVYSSPGLGTTFHVLLPASTRKRTERTNARSQFDLPNRGLILVIDDEELIRSLAKSILTRRGFQVITAENGLAGVNLFREQQNVVSLVILDLLMPVMSGEETLDQILQIRPDVPVLLSSGFDESEAGRQFVGKRVAGFIQKPYNIERLLLAIEDALTRTTRGLSGGPAVN